MNLVNTKVLFRLTFYSKIEFNFLEELLNIYCTVLFTELQGGSDQIECLKRDVSFQATLPHCHRWQPPALIDQFPLHRKESS